MSKNEKGQESPKIPRYSDKFKDRIKESAEKYANLFTSM